MIDDRSMPRSPTPIKPLDQARGWASTTAVVLILTTALSLAGWIWLIKFAARMVGEVQ